jgi:hypothetical protein
MKSVKADYGITAKSLLLAPLMLSLFAGQAASAIIFQSATSAATFSSAYSAEWFTFVDEEGLPKIRVSVTIKDVDTSDWGTQGNMGYWLGIGLGSQTMAGADIIMCAFSFTGEASND